MYQLVGISGTHKGHSWPVDEQGVLLGRGAGCDVMVADPAVSRRHCRITLDGGCVRIEDLGSRHPALVNGHPLKSGVLYPKDVVAIGPEVFLVVVECDASDTGFAPQSTPRTATWTRMRPHRAAAASTPEDDGRPHTLDDLVIWYEMARALGRARTLDSLAAVVTEWLVKRFAPRARWVARIDRKGGMHFWTGENEEAQPVTSAPREIMTACLDSGEGLLAPCARIIEGEEVRALVMAAPVLFDECRLGVLAVETHPPAIYTESDLQMFLLMAANVAPYVYVVETAERMRRDFERLRTNGDDSIEIVGESRSIAHLRAETRKAGRSSLHVLICGESGVGKELVARGIHAASDRSTKPLVVMNCAAIPRDLVESQLFGHTKGAFTGAVEARPGLLAQAHGGMLFLDEVGDLSLDNQARLLRVIEAGTYLPVGAHTETYADFRVIAATNKDLPAAIDAGLFRRDLYYRLNGFEIHVPPLHEHPSDIPLLANHFFEKGKHLAKRPLTGISAEAIAYLCKRNWPGNVRELRNVIIRGISVAEGAGLQLRDVMIEHIQPLAVPEPAGMHSLDQAVKHHIEAALRHCRGDVGAAAKLLEISRSALYRKMAEFGISRHG